MRLFATASLMLLLPAAGIASDRYHVVTPSFGCVVPWTTWALNDGHNPHRRDARWLNRIIERGSCRLVSPIQEWERVGRIGRLVLLRQVPPHVGATPLLFRPSDLRVGGIADPAPAPPEATTPSALPEPPAGSPGQPDPAQEADAPPPAAPASTDATPSGASDPPPSAAAPLSVSGAASGEQAPAPATPDAIPPSTSSTGSDPATQAPPAAATQEPPVVATPLPDLPAATAAPAPAPAPVAATPAPPPALQVPAPVAPPPAPAASAPDAVAHPPAAVPAHAASIPWTNRTMTRRNRLVVGLVAILALLAGLIVIGLFLVRRRRGRAERSRAELHDARPELPADEAEVPPIDNNAYRQWCVASLTEAGWQARMSFPAGRLTADIIARRDGRLLTVQCRPSTRPLEAAVVQEALVVRRAQDAQVAAVVSNAGYTKAARNLAAASGVRLLHETELTEFVN